MKTTSRIDSEVELSIFLHQLAMANIEIPSNVTLEIDSSILKSEFNKLAQTWMPGEIEPMKLIKYKGEKITFKSEQQERMYSEENVFQFFEKYREDFPIHRNIQILDSQFKEWFEQFKKK